MSLIFDKEFWLRVQQNLRLNRFFAFIVTLIQKAGADDCPGLAAQMAYYWLLSIIPTLIFIFSLMGVLGEQNRLLPFAQDVIDFLAPPHTADILFAVVEGVVASSSDSLTVLGFLVALLAAAGNAGTLIRGIHRAYGVEPHTLPFWYGMTMSVVMMIALGLLSLVVTQLVVFGDILLAWLAPVMGFSSQDMMLLGMLRWTIGLGSVLVLANFIYALLLHRSVRKMLWWKVFPGSITFLALWLTLSFVFTMYVNQAGRFNPVFGTLGGVVLLLTWLYFTALSLLLGAEVIWLVSVSRQEAGKDEAA